MFKRGDQIKCLKTYKDQFTRGRTYTVSHDTDISSVQVESDDNGEPNGWICGNFRLVNENKEMEMEKKNKVNYSVLNDSIVLNYSGKTVLVASDDKRYEAVLQAIRDAKGDEGALALTIPEIVEIERRYKGDGIELKDGLLMANNEPLPVELETRIMKFKELKLPFAPLLKFWENLKTNPSFNSRKMLFKFLEHHGHPLTNDGCFIAYRGVTEDFKDVHTQTFDNKVGSTCEMPRSQVDDDPNKTCSSGLHVAAFDYAKGFGAKLVEVKVNPADVVCVPVDYSGQKMRVCRFEVVALGSKIKDTVLETFENDNGCPNDDNEADLAIEGKAAVEVNGKGQDRQRRYAVRGPRGTFVKQGA